MERKRGHMVDEKRSSLLASEHRLQYHDGHVGALRNQHLPLAPVTAPVVGSAEGQTPPTWRRRWTSSSASPGSSCGEYRFVWLMNTRSRPPIGSPISPPIEWARSRDK